MPRQPLIGRPSSDENFSASEFFLFGRRALYLSYLIDDISRIQCSVMDRMLKPLNTTRAQGWILHYVSWRPGSTPAEIARALDVTGVAAGKIVDALLDRKLVTVLPDPNNKRLRRIHLTPEGRRLVKRFALAGETLSASTMSGFDEERARVILDFLLDMKFKLIAARDSEPGAIESLVPEVNRR